MRKKVIFVCNGNSARSQMAEGFLRKLGGDRYDVYSGGMVARGIHPMTIQVMREVGIDISGQYSKVALEYYSKIVFDVAVIVCRKAEDDCPKIAGMTRNVQRWIFDDPLRAQGTEEEKLAKFKEVRNQVEARLKLWLAEDMEADLAS
ncbi:MAG: arsenate reductase ArsC [Anaerolineaceae bacterium]|nr:arsenate reductase ArsC [Anaerolineaceae bacterium]